MALEQFQPAHSGVDLPPREATKPADFRAKMRRAGMFKILSLELSMEILFRPWLPPVLLALGIYMLLKTKGVGPKIVGGLLVLVGGLLVAFEIWIYSKHYHR
jgi:hypothetical protein